MTAPILNNRKQKTALCGVREFYADEIFRKATYYCVTPKKNVNYIARKQGNDN